VIGNWIPDRFSAKWTKTITTMAIVLNKSMEE
jgi:hypothetical protein